MDSPVNPPGPAVGGPDKLGGPPYAVGATANIDSLKICITLHTVYLAALGSNSQTHFKHQSAADTSTIHENGVDSNFTHKCKSVGLT